MSIARWAMLYGAAIAVVVGTPMGLLVIAWLAGAVRTDGTVLDWQVIEALATMAAALAALLGLGALFFAARELENRSIEVQGQTEDGRVLRMPYLRVDIGLLGAASPGFTPRETGYIYDASDLGLGALDHPAHPLRAEPEEGGAYPLIIWVTNLQTLSLGIAYRVRLGALIAWSDNGATEAATVEVEFSYVAPGQTTAFRLGYLPRRIAWFMAEVQDVGYEDFFGRERLPDAHGAMRVVYDRSRGVTNERRFQLSRTRPADPDDRPEG